MPTTFYLDQEGGNDGNDGTSFANRWKTITNGATAARIAPGDTIRIMASPDPTSLGQSASWTHASGTVTLTSAVTGGITDCNSQWSAGDINATITQSTARKEGTYSASCAVNASFTTGKVAYYATGTLDLSGYQQVCFWFRQTAGTVFVDGDLSLCLCSDAAGATPVNTVPIPAIKANNTWCPIVVDLDTNLGNAIQSVALYINVDGGAQTFLIDNIFAAKDSASADALTLRSLIGKNSAGETWWPLKSIVGTTLIIDNGMAAEVGVSRGYVGTTESATIYKREAIATALSSTAAGQVSAITDSGTSGSPITYSGGWNRTDMSTQTGQTWFDGVNGLGAGLYATNKDFVAVDNLHLTRYSYGLYLVSASEQFVGTTISLVGCNVYGIYNSGGAKSSFDDLVINSCGNHGIYAAAVTPQFYGAVACLSGLQQGIYATGSYIMYAKDLVTRNNAAYGVNCAGSAVIDKWLSSDNNSGGWYQSSTGVVALRLADINDTAEVTFNTSMTGSNERVVSEQHDYSSGAGAHKIFTDGGVIASDTTNRHTASGICWKISPTDTNRDAVYPLDVVVARVAVAASALVTVKAWMYRDNAGLTGMLVCRGGQIGGVASDVSASVSGTGSYEEVTITFTPNEAGVVTIEAWAYGGTTYNLYVDDLTITQA